MCLLNGLRWGFGRELGERRRKLESKDAMARGHTKDDDFKAWRNNRRQ